MENTDKIKKYVSNQIKIFNEYGRDIIKIIEEEIKKDKSFFNSIDFTLCQTSKKNNIYNFLTLNINQLSRSKDEYIEAFKTMFYIHTKENSDDSGIFHLFLLLASFQNCKNSNNNDKEVIKNFKDKVDKERQSLEKLYEKWKESVKKSLI